MDTTAIQSILESGKIGDVPFAVWLRYKGASTDVQHIACVLAEKGVLSMRWEQDKLDARQGRRWQSFLVLSLPVLTSTEEPSLSAQQDVKAIASELRNPVSY